MKRTFKSIMFVAAAAMAFSACNVEPIETPEEIIGTHKVTFVASQAETKTTMKINDGIASFAWEKTDEAFFHVFEDGEPALEAVGDIVDNKMQILAEFVDGTATSYTYTGFMAATLNPNESGNPVVGDEQLDCGAYDPTSDILVAKPITVDAQKSLENPISFQFKRVVAINQMTLKGLTTGETVEDVTITSDKPIAGEYDFTNGAWNASETSISITAEAEANADGQAVVYFVSAPVEGAQLTVTATTAAGKTYSKKLAKTITFNEGGVKAFGVTVEAAAPVEESYIELTNTDIAEMAGSYADGTISNSYGDWPYNACKQSRDGYTFMQIRNNATFSYIQIPQVDGDITRIVLSDVCNGSNGKYTGDVYFRTNLSNATEDVIAQSNSATKAFDELSIELSGSYSTGYVMSSGPCRFTKIRVYYSTVSKTALSTPTNLAVDASTKVVSWTAVENAGSYLVTIGDNEPVVATTNLYDATAIADEYYNVSVVAVPTDTDTYKNSDAATLKGAKFGDPWLTTPVLSAGAIDESSITVTWTNDARATNGYEAVIYKDMGDGTVRKLTNTDSDQMNIMTGTATFTGLEENQAYEIRVMAMPVTEPRAYHFSSNGTIKLSTKAPQHISDINETDISYTIKGLTVFAENIGSKSTNIIVGDSTGYVLVFVNGTSNIPAIGSTIDVSGTVKEYNGVYEFDNPTISNVTTGSVAYGTPNELDEDDLNAYAKDSYIDYVTVKGYKQSSGYLMEVGDEIVNLYGDSSDYNGKYVIVTGFVFGYYSEKTNLMLVDIEDDTTVPTLSIDKNSKEWAWDNTDAFVVNVSANAGSWTVSPETLTWAIVTVNATAGTITVTPNGENTSDADHESTLTVTHSADASLTKTITLKQTKEPESVDVTYTKVTNASSLQAGDVIVIALAAKGKAAGAKSGDYLSSVNATFNGNTLTKTDDIVEFTLGGDSSAWTLTSGEGTLGATAAKKLSYTSGTTTWTISIADGLATIASTNEACGRFLYNNGSPRFLNYTSAASASMLLPEIYKKEVKNK